MALMDWPRSGSNTYDAAFHHGGVFHQHIFHLVRADPEAAGLDDVIEAAVEPVEAVFIHRSCIPCMIYAAPPGMIILLGIVQIRCEYSDLAAVFGRHG